MMDDYTDWQPAPFFMDFPDTDEDMGPLKPLSAREFELLNPLSFFEAFKPHYGLIDKLPLCHDKIRLRQWLTDYKEQMRSLVKRNPTPWLTLECDDVNKRHTLYCLRETIHVALYEAVEDHVRRIQVHTYSKSIKKFLYVLSP